MTSMTTAEAGSKRLLRILLPYFPLPFFPYSSIRHGRRLELQVVDYAH
jgi:hypothetical protein